MTKYHYEANNFSYVVHFFVQDKGRIVEMFVLFHFNYRRLFMFYIVPKCIFIPGLYYLTFDKEKIVPSS